MDFKLELTRYEGQCLVDSLQHTVQTLGLQISPEAFSAIQSIRFKIEKQSKAAAEIIDADVKEPKEEDK